MKDKWLETQVDFFQTAESAAEGARLCAQEAERECRRAEATTADEALAAHSAAQDALRAAYEAAAVAAYLVESGDPYDDWAEASAERAQGYANRAAEHLNRFNGKSL